MVALISRTRVLTGLAVVALLPAACGGAAEATLGTFSGTWYGHTRSLTISHGHARESIGSGCCDPVIDLELELSRPHGRPNGATAIVTVTAVRVRDTRIYTKARPAPRVGQTGTLRLRGGVITESLTRTNYCDKTAGRAGKCGA